MTFKPDCTGLWYKGKTQSLKFGYVRQAEELEKLRKGTDMGKQFCSKCNDYTEFTTGGCLPCSIKPVPVDENSGTFIYQEAHTPKPYNICFNIGGWGVQIHPDGSVTKTGDAPGWDECGQKFFDAVAKAYMTNTNLGDKLTKEFQMFIQELSCDCHPDFNDPSVTEACARCRMISRLSYVYGIDADA